MKTFLQLATLLVALSTARAASTINTNNHYAWAGNLGWVYFRAERPNAGDGFKFGELACGGWLWSPNIGWIDCGDGTPANGSTYGNFGNTDYGVNHLGNGDLAGLAWAPNVGWINFGWAASTNVNRPRVDLLTGEFSGYAWGANIGWIDLASSSLKTDTMKITDTDNDGISDAYEMNYAGDLDTMTGSSDTDGDGIKDKDEYIAGTSPLGFNGPFQITRISKIPNLMAEEIEWPSSPARVYGIEFLTDLGTDTWTFAADVAGGSGATTTAAVSGTQPHVFLRVQAKLPLQP